MHTFLAIGSDITAFKTPAPVACWSQGQPTVNAEAVRGIKKVGINAMGRPDSGDLFHNLRIATIVELHTCL